MERWENRYTHGRTGGAHGGDHSRAERVRSIVIILLVVALVSVGIVGGKAIAFRGRSEDSLTARALVECGNAVAQVNTLSRSGGSDTAAVLGKIRANIHATDLLNQLCISLHGRALVEPSSFTELYSIIDSYSTKLKNGSATIDELTNLSNQLAALQAILQEVQ